MKNSDINRFIEEMKEIGDVWKFKDVKRVYGKYDLEIHFILHRLVVLIPLITEQLLLEM